MAITFGATTAPLSITTYLDSLFSLSLANYRKKLIDQIGSTNALLYFILKNEAYEAAEGGTHIDEQLLYAFGKADPYDGYDELSTIPVDGVTSAIYQWRQLAVPIVYNMKEVIQNKQKLLDLVTVKMQQAEMGFQESFAEHLMWGQYQQGGSIMQPYLNINNGALSLDPLPLVVSYNTAGSSGTAQTVGGLSEYINPWWRNRSFTCTATSYSTFIFQLMHAFNTVALGTGGRPNLILMDQVTYELYTHAYFSIYKTPPGDASGEYPFEAKKFMGATVVMDDKVPDVASGAPGVLTGGSIDSSTMTYGSAYFLNTKFFKLRYDKERDFDMLKDENGKTFKKPINGDSRVGHSAWMGQLTVNNRRKHGVMGQIPRSFAT